MAKAQVAAALADRDHARADWERAKALLPTNAMAKKDYDQAKAANDMAEERYNEAVKQYSMVTEGPRQEQIDQARAKFHQAEAALELAKTQLSYAKVYSPLDGVVFSKNIEPGEYVGRARRSSPWPIWSTSGCGRTSMRWIWDW